MYVPRKVHRKTEQANCPLERFTFLPQKLPVARYMAAKLRNGHNFLCNEMWKLRPFLLMECAYNIIYCFWARVVNHGFSIPSACLFCPVEPGWGCNTQSTTQINNIVKDGAAMTKEKRWSEYTVRLPVDLLLRTVYRKEIIQKIIIFVFVITFSFMLPNIHLFFLFLFCLERESLIIQFTNIKHKSQQILKTNKQNQW